MAYLLRFFELGTLLESNRLEDIVPPFVKLHMGAGYPGKGSDQASMFHLAGAPYANWLFLIFMPGVLPFIV